MNNRIVEGSFSTFGFISNTLAPSVQAYWFIPRLGIGELAQFMVDTGASNTCLNGIHAYGLRGKLRSGTLTKSFGIAGSCEYYHERATLVFIDSDNERFSRTISMSIQKIEDHHLHNPDYDVLQCPNLLGRDILQHCRLEHDFPDGRITLRFTYR